MKSLEAALASLSLSRACVENDEAQVRAFNAFRKELAAFTGRPRAANDHVAQTLTLSTTVSPELAAALLERERPLDAAGRSSGGRI